MSRIATVVNDLRNGLGAIKLRSDVKKVTLVFSGKSDNAGARYYLELFRHRVECHHGVSPSGPLHREERQRNRMFTGGIGRRNGLHEEHGQGRRKKSLADEQHIQSRNHRTIRTDKGRSVVVVFAEGEGGVLFSTRDNSSVYTFRIRQERQLIHQKSMDQPKKKKKKKKKKKNPTATPTANNN
jgi:hypothetical protein